jgi:ribosome silencing factor RsfS/YbeB/iojap
LSTRKRKAPAALDPFEQLSKLINQALDDLKARDVMHFDVRGLSAITDLVVIASGTSTRHVKSLADNVQKLAKGGGFTPIGIEGARESEWVLVDLGDAIVHLMLPRTRAFYNLEKLWGGDGPAHAFEREAEALA